MDKIIEGVAEINSKTVSFRLIGNRLQITYKPDDAIFVTTAELNDEGKVSFRRIEHIRVATFYGTTNDSKRIAFKISTSIVRYFYDLIDCTLECYYILDSERFNSITIISSDIHAITNDHNHPISMNNKEITVCFEGQKRFFDVKLSDCSTVEFSCYEAFKTMSKNKHPIEYLGQIQIVFDETDSVDRAFELIELARSFVTYLTFRRDIVFDEVFLGNFGKHNSRFIKKGTYYPLNNPDRISNTELLTKRRIPFSLIENIASSLIENISNNSIYTEHMRTSLTNRRLIYGSDIVTLTAGFEFEFGKSSIVIEKKKSEKDQVAYIKKRYNNILKSDKLNSFGRSTVKNAAKHIDDLLLEAKLNSFFKTLPESFVFDWSGLYDTYNIPFKSSLISKAVSEARNKIAHGDLVYQISQEVIMAFIMLESMIYFIQLKRLGLDDETNCKCVKQLFGL